MEKKWSSIVLLGCIGMLFATPMNKVSYANSENTAQVPSLSVLPEKLQSINEQLSLPTQCSEINSSTATDNDQCADHLKYFKINGSEEFKKRTQEVLKNLGQIEIGKQLLSKFTCELAIEEDAKKSYTDGKKVYISYQQLDQVNPLGKDPKGKILPSKGSVECAVFHELVHFYYETIKNLKRKRPIEDHLYDNGEELATITGESSIYCKKKSLGECQNKYYKFNENECRRQMQLDDRYSHRTVGSGLTSLNQYYLCLSDKPYNPQEMRSNNFNKHIANLSQATGSIIEKYRAEFGISDEELAKTCELILRNNDAWDKQNGYFFHKLLNQHPNEVVVKECAAKFTKERLKNILKKGDHYYLSNVHILAQIKNNKMADEFFQTSAFENNIDMVNALLRDENDWNQFIKRNYSFNYHNSTFQGNPCEFKNKLKENYLKNKKEFSTTMINNLFFLFDACNEQNISEVFDENSPAKKEEGLMILCNLAPEIIKKQYQPLFTSFYQKYKDFIVQKLNTNSNNILSTCFENLKIIDEEIALTSNALVDIFDSNTIPEKIIDTAKKDFEKLDKSAFSKIIQDKIKKLFTGDSANQDDNDTAEEKISNLVRNMISLEKVLTTGKHFYFMDCGIIEALTENNDDFNPSSFEDKNAIAELLTFLSEMPSSQRLKCPQELEAKLRELCQKFDIENECSWKSRGKKLFKN
ncbi:MAG: hypothetical protein HQK52_05235 [Oligoflexia bacterium]|nr:hypothetical protein [Oligoflexia bacterium]